MTHIPDTEKKVLEGKVIALWESMIGERIAFQHEQGNNMNEEKTQLLDEILKAPVRLREHIQGTERRIEQLEANQKFIYEALQALASGIPLPNLKEELKERLK